MAQREYQRLTRAKARGGFHFVSSPRTSLWLGRDHLLLIEGSGYTERYKRFYFRDIQAVTLRTTATWKVVGLALGFFGGLFALFAALSHAQGAAWFLGSVAAFLGVLLVIHLLEGATCRCYIQTAVQTEQIVSISRLRQARKILRRLRPFIAEAQGTLAPEEIPARFQEWTGAPAPSFTADDPNLPSQIV